ncbi:MAG: alanine--tRNA ligase [Porphyromonas sp.]|nr:alanine--tRNA ligase [Porphyromonas sp.]
MITANEIRQQFLDFFESKGHHIVPSAPMVIKDDPTLMFTNAGMNQFKDIILGNAPAKYPRVADSQKCLRVSGKHNDLEEVGHDTYHHTMFEMLGNWSFGDYFKKEAIAWAWELLTEVYKLPKEHLYVTIFEGAESEGLERDNEAEELWREHIDPSHILEGNKHDNFWEMGDTGPCGPCSEIHVDLRPDAERKALPAVELVNKDHPQVIEIWNLVFMQYNRMADGHLEPLPQKVIDTGMGFERLCMALQGKQSNYDTDVFTPLIAVVEKLSGIKYGTDEKSDVAMRVVSDHVRTIAFSITDGQLPSNAKAGYVIRRILRRAVRYGYTFLDQHEPFVYKLVPTLVKLMGEHYPELAAQESIITRVIEQEEASFLRTLETGIQLLNRHIQSDLSETQKVLPGKVVFELYDTYGFPTDLTDLILREQGYSADVEGFDREMALQKERARSAAQVEASDWVVVHEGETHFTGYDETEGETVILRYREVVKQKKKKYQIVLSHSPFYAEMGGQVGDRGSLRGMTDGEVIQVVDTIRENNLPICMVEKLPSEPDQPFYATIDVVRRRQIEANHTATHLLHNALRKILGTHVEQKGSYVSDDLLRFDFSHFSKLTKEEIRQVEQEVNRAIRNDLHREEVRHMPIAEAKEMGAIAFFGEKYGEDVRVIQYGDSIELCGGTHIHSTGMIGTFRIISEGSIAAGIRRVEAVTREGAERYLYEQEDTLMEVQELLHNPPKVADAVRKLLEEVAGLEEELLQAQEARKKQLLEQVQKEAVEKSGTLLYTLSENVSPQMAKDIAFGLKALHKESDFVFVAGSISADKPTLTLMISDSLVERGHNAGKLVREAGKLIKGGGGGQPGFATAGGRDATGLEGAIAFVKRELGLE